MGHRTDKLWWEGVVGRGELGVFLNAGDTSIWVDNSFFCSFVLCIVNIYLSLDPTH